MHQNMDMALSMLVDRRNSLDADSKFYARMLNGSGVKTSREYLIMALAAADMIEYGLALSEDGCETKEETLAAFHKMMTRIDELEVIARGKYPGLNIIEQTYDVLRRRMGRQIRNLGEVV